VVDIDVQQDLSTASSEDINVPVKQGIFYFT